jgi:hypothetical protein
VDESDYSADDHRKGSIFLSKLFEPIKDKPLSDDEDLKSLSIKFLTDIKYIGLGGGELKRLEDRLRGKGL